MTTERSVFIFMVILLLAIVVACCLILAFAGSHEEELEESDDPDTRWESLKRMREAQDDLNEELVRFIGEEDRATGRKPLVERLKD